MVINMPTTREDHVIYTRNELENNSYYIKILEELNNNEIKSYIDVGANVGEFCNVLFEKIPTLTMGYLIEPEINNYNFMLHNLKNTNVKTYNVCIGYNLKSATLKEFNNNVGGFSLVENDNSGIQVTIVTLEELKLPKVDFIKIDIEGGEFNLLENTSFLNNIMYIDIEWHNNDFLDYEYLKKYVNKFLPNHDIIIMEVNRSLLKLKI